MNMGLYKIQNMLFLCLEKGDKMLILSTFDILQNATKKSKHYFSFI